MRRGLYLASNLARLLRWSYVCSKISARHSFLIASCDSTSQKSTSLSPPENSDISTAADLSGAVSDNRTTADVGS